MQVPMRIVVKNVPRPDEARALAREAASVLERMTFDEGAWLPPRL